MNGTSRPQFLLSILLTCLALFVFIGCSDSGSGKSSTDSGDLMISLTDAEGDFASYTVDVISITLTKANGAVVDTLPATTRVDFAQYTEMSELLTVSTLPLGAYKKATMLLDYSAADIMVEDSEGNIIEASTINDEDGNPVAEMEVSVFLENGSALVIAPGVTSHMTLDFDLKASNTVTFDAEGAADVVVEPSLIAEVDKSNSWKTNRIRGLLGDVVPEMNYFYVTIHPFHKIFNKPGHFGNVMVQTGSSTLYDINGELFTGSDGLNEVAQLDSNTAIIINGKFKNNPKRFEASEVYAGSSVPGGDQDVAKGNVISRSEDTLTLRGATLIRNGGAVDFNDTALIIIGDTTSVKKQKSTELFTINDISVGQKISVFGELSYNEAGTPVIDATEGTVCMLSTTLNGTVADTTSPDADLAVNLNSINRRSIDMFDFTGTGSTPETDADPTMYEINTDALDISSFIAATPMKAYGFMTPYASAPADFTAQSLVNLNDVTAFIKIKWAPPSTDPFESITDEAITFNLDGTTRFHHLGRGGIISDLDDMPDAPIIVPAESGVYVITMRSKVEVYTDFSEFTAAVSTLIDGHNRVNKLFVSGKFNSTTATFSADYLLIKIH